MPAIGFICPDGQTTTFEECFSECRLRDHFPTGRCKALPFLRKLAKQRPWEGIPSVTQLLSGTREQMLKITKDYFIDPERKVTALIGTNTHYVLYKLADTQYAEETLYQELLQGTYDMYDPISKTLYDYKTWGVWKLAKILKGDPQRRADALFDVVVQMHLYKQMFLEKYPELEIQTLAVQVICRESDLRQAHEAQIPQGSPVLVLPTVSDTVITKYAQLKKHMLKTAIETQWAPVCTKRENWEGKKCLKWCDAREFCLRMTSLNTPLWEELKMELFSRENAILSEIMKNLENTKVTLWQKEESILNF
ncbi:MAG: hypothetical protein ACPLSN_03670 [Dictyoglomus turgidum]